MKTKNVYGDTANDVEKRLQTVKLKDPYQQVK